MASRRPHHPVGWLLLTFGLVEVASLVAHGYLAYGLLARPGALPATGAAVIIHGVGYSGAPVTLLALALLLTPTGSLPSRRWRWVAGALVAVAVINALGTPLQPGPLEPPLESVTSPLAIDAPRAGPLRVDYNVVGSMVGGVFVVAVVAAAGSLVVRFRRARGTERRQLRLLAFAAALVPAAALVALAATLAGRPAVVRFAAGTVSWLVPLGLGQRLGQESSLVVGGATLAVAAVFQPARHRIQQAVDRRFNRRRHNAAQTLQAFSGRLRQQVDLDSLTVELLAVVEDTMQPTQASLWLRPQPSSGMAGAVVAPQRG